MPSKIPILFFGVVGNGVSECLGQFWGLCGHHVGFWTLGKALFYKNSQQTVFLVKKHENSIFGGQDGLKDPHNVF